jgi:hypothetical protein
MKKLVLVLVLALVLVAHADDTTLPFNPFEKAQKGDWCAHAGGLKADGANEKKLQLASQARVVSVEGDDVVLRESANEEKPTKTTFSTKKAPTIEQLLGLKDGKVTDVKVTDESRKLDDKKELACKKVTFTWTQAANKYEGTLWLSPEVKGGGIVALHLKGHEKGIGQGGAKGKDGEEHKADLLIESSTKLEVTGWGNGDKADWGESPDADSGDDDAKLKLPLDPFANAKKGDWAAYVVEVDMGERTEKAVMNFEVARLKKNESIKLDRSITGDHNQEGDVTFALDDAIDPGQFVATIIKSPRSDMPATRGGKVTDVKKKVGDKEFDAKQVSFAIDDGRSKVKVKLWLSADVHATSIIAMELKVNEGGRPMTISMELGGYGDDDKTTWGKPADKLGKKKKKDEDE